MSESPKGLSPKEKRDVVDLSAAYADAGLESFISEGLGGVAGTAMKLLRAAQSFRDYQLRKKVLSFCSGCTPDEEKKRLFGAKMVGNSEYRNRVGEVLFTALDQLNDQSKARVLGTLFCAYIEQKISWDDFSRYSRALTYAYYKDLLAFIENDVSNPPWVLEPFATGGMVVQESSTLYSGDPDYKLTDLGARFMTAMRSYPRTLWMSASFDIEENR